MKIRAAEDEGVKLLFVASCNVMCDETVGKRICLNDPPTLQVRSLTTVMFGTDYYFLVHVTCAQRFWRAHSSTHHVIAIIIYISHFEIVPLIVSNPKQWHPSQTYLQQSMAVHRDISVKTFFNDSSRLWTSLQTEKWIVYLRWVKLSLCEFFVRQ
jgi:hypothetical protein